MWVMLCQKLPVRPSPPAASIFWSTPWADDRYANEQIKKAKEIKKGNFDLKNLERQIYYPYSNVPGREPNWVGARKIHYKGGDIRIFPHEFSEVSTANMRAYVLGIGTEGPSHELVPDSIAEEDALQNIKNGDQRILYDAALLDGCNHAQAVLTALGKDITIEDAEFPAIGWYRCSRDIALHFFDDKDLLEN